MERMRSHAQRFETEVVNDHIHAAVLDSRPFRLQGDYGQCSCDALIIAIRIPRCSSASWICNTAIS